MRNKTRMRRNIHPKCSCMMPSWHKNGNYVFLFQAWHLHRQVICGSNLAYLQCGPHPGTPPAAIRDWNSFHHDWNLLEFFPILSTHCMECYNLHGVYNLHGMYSFEQHSIAIDSHENVMEQLSTSLNSVA